MWKYSHYKSLWTKEAIKKVTSFQNKASSTITRAGIFVKDHFGLTGVKFINDALSSEFIMNININTQKKSVLHIPISIVEKSAQFKTDSYR